MKKKTGFLLITFTAFALMGCGAVSDNASKDASSVQQSQTEEKNLVDAAFEYKENTFSLFDDPNIVIDKLTACDTGKSSTYIHLDKEYYDGYQSPTMDYEIMNNSTFMYAISDESVRTSNGISIGSTQDEVIAAYDNAGERIGNWILCDFEDYYIIFYFDDDDKVYKIEYVINDTK